MADNELDIMIRVVADAAGIKLTADQLEKAKENFGAFSREGQRSAENVDVAMEKLGFR
jgi:hypothetical protein